MGQIFTPVKDVKKKKKKRAPAKRKQKAGMILAFDSNKTQVTNVVKKMLNVQSAKKTRGQPRRQVKLKVAAPAKNSADLQKNNDYGMLHKAVDDSQPNIVLDQVPSGSTSKTNIQVRQTH